MTSAPGSRRVRSKAKPIPAEPVEVPPPVRDTDEPMTAEQATELKVLAYQTYEPDAYDPQITRAEAQRRIAALSAKLKLLDEPPHTL
jgi:Protein of unknown function (DUF3072)